MCFLVPFSVLFLFYLRISSTKIVTFVRSDLTEKKEPKAKQHSHRSNFGKDEEFHNNPLISIDLSAKIFWTVPRGGPLYDYFEEAFRVYKVCISADLLNIYMHNKGVKLPKSIGLFCRNGG